MLVGVIFVVLNYVMCYQLELTYNRFLNSKKPDAKTKYLLKEGKVIA